MISQGELRVEVQTIDLLPQRVWFHSLPMPVVLLHLFFLHNRLLSCPYIYIYTSTCFFFFNLNSWLRVQSFYLTTFMFQPLLHSSEEKILCNEPFSIEKFIDCAPPAQSGGGILRAAYPRLTVSVAERKEPFHSNAQHHWYTTAWWSVVRLEKRLFKMRPFSWLMTEQVQVPVWEAFDLKNSLESSSSIRTAGGISVSGRKRVSFFMSSMHLSHKQA